MQRFVIAFRGGIPGSGLVRQATMIWDSLACPGRFPRAGRLLMTAAPVDRPAAARTG